MKYLECYRIKLVLVGFVAASIVLAGIVLGASTMASHAKPSSDRCSLIGVHVVDRDDVDTLVNTDLDIWEYREGGPIIRVTDDERKQIEASGFILDTITKDFYGYTETIRRGQISLFAEPTPAKYHSYDEVIANLIALEASGVAKTYIIGSTHEGRDIWAVKISDNPAEDEEEPGALFLGCHHAREWMSVEVPLYVGQYLIDNYDIDEDVKHLVDNCEIWMVPVVNPDGYEYSRITDQMWEKNRRNNGDGTFGVNLSCNYSYKWGGQGSKANTSSGGYRGPSAFSESETRAVRDLAIAYDFRVMITYHSFGQMVFSPWGHSTDPCPDDIPMSTMKLTIRNLIKETSGAVYIDWWDWPGAFVSSGGEESDWFYGELGVYSFAVELGPWSGGFFPPENLINIISEENLPAALYLISYAAADYGIENLATGKTYSNIQLAVNDANDGDEIVVNSGVYHENVSFIDKNLTLRSIDPNDPSVVASTVINIEDLYQGSVIALSGSRDRVYVLDGLTITGGEVGISCRDLSPTIRNCVVGSNGPNAIEFWEGHEPPTIIECAILGHVAEVDDPTMIAHWALDETEGSIAENSVGDNDGTLFGEPLWHPTGGRRGGTLQFDGVDDYVSTEYVLSPADGEFSVFAWIKDGAPGQVLLSQAGATNWLTIDSVDGGAMSELKGTGRSTGGPLLSQIIITDGDWHRIGLVWDGSYRHLYVDGAEVAKDAAPLSDLADAHGGLYLGTGATLAPGTFFSGLIDDVRIYNRAVKP